jgi:hypothetical protein
MWDKQQRQTAFDDLVGSRLLQGPILLIGSQPSSRPKKRSSPSIDNRR